MWLRGHSCICINCTVWKCWLIDCCLYILSLQPVLPWTTKVVTEVSRHVNNFSEYLCHRDLVFQWKACTYIRGGKKRDISNTMVGCYACTSFPIEISNGKFSRLPSTTIPAIVAMLVTRRWPQKAQKGLSISSREACTNSVLHVICVVEHSFYEQTLAKSQDFV